MLYLSLALWHQSTGEAVDTVRIDGLVNGRAVPGTEATLIAVMSDISIIITGFIWGTTYRGDELGTGPNPTSIEGADRLYLTVNTAEGPFDTSAPVQTAEYLADNTGLVFITSDDFRFRTD